MVSRNYLVEILGAYKYLKIVLCWDVTPLNGLEPRTTQLLLSKPVCNLKIHRFEKLSPIDSRHFIYMLAHNAL
jgi:hypothetical protein